MQAPAPGPGRRRADGYSAGARSLQGPPTPRPGFSPGTWGGRRAWARSGFLLDGSVNRAGTAEPRGGPRADSRLHLIPPLRQQRLPRVPARERTKGGPSVRGQSQRWTENRSGVGGGPCLGDPRSRGRDWTEEVARAGPGTPLLGSFGFVTAGERAEGRTGTRFDLTA